MIVDKSCFGQNYLCGYVLSDGRQTSTLAMHKRTAHNDESGATEAELVLNPVAQVFTSKPSLLSKGTDGN